MQDLLENRIKSFSAGGKSPPPQQTNPLPPWWQTTQPSQLSHPLDILRMAALLSSTEIEEVRLPFFRIFALYSSESSPPSLLVPNSLRLIISRTLIWVERQCWNWGVGVKGVQKTCRKIFLNLIFLTWLFFNFFIFSTKNDKYSTAPVALAQYVGCGCFEQGMLSQSSFKVVSSC